MNIETKNQYEEIILNNESEEYLNSIITNIIHEIGIPAHIKGYQYIREAIILVIKDVNIINKIT